MSEEEILQANKQPRTREEEVMEELQSRRYNDQSESPYVLILQGTHRPDGSTSRIGKLHPISIAKILARKMRSIQEVEKIGSNKIKLVANDYHELNRIITDRYLREVYHRSIHPKLQNPAARNYQRR